jgi:hypothetical protein
MAQTLEAINRTNQTLSSRDTPDDSDPQFHPRVVHRPAPHDPRLRR